MTTVRGKITSCRKNRKGFKLDDDNWYSRPDGEPMEHLDEWRENGTVIEIDYFETKDGWKNFTGNPKVIEKTEPTQASKSSGSKNGFKKGGSYKKEWSAYEDKDWQIHVNNRIARQNALNNAVALVSSSKLDTIGPEEVDLVTTVANLFLEWVEGGES